MWTRGFLQVHFLHITLLFEILTIIFININQIVPSKWVADVGRKKKKKSIQNKEYKLSENLLVQMYEKEKTKANIEIITETNWNTNTSYLQFYLQIKWFR